MTNLDAARKAWLSDQPIYAQFGKELVSRLKAAIRHEGIWAEVSSRAKDVDSLIRKLIKKPHYSYDSLGDKTGARVTVHYKDEINPILEIAAGLFDCSEPEDKADTLKPDQVGYLSVHVDVRLRPSDLLATTYPPEKFRAELQVRTLGQHLWSEMSHDTFYKNDETLNPLPNAIKRRIYILAGVVEMADNEFNRLNHDAQTTPEVSLLKSLERHYFKLTVRRGDPELSLDIIRLLIPLYNSQEARQIAAHLEEFYASHEDVLTRVYEEAEGMADRSAFLYQPEALMIYDRLKTDSIGVRKIWNEHYPEAELERVANAFGISFD